MKLRFQVYALGLCLLTGLVPETGLAATDEGSAATPNLETAAKELERGAFEGAHRGAMVALEELRTRGEPKGPVAQTALRILADSAKGLQEYAEAEVLLRELGRALVLEGRADDAGDIRREAGRCADYENVMELFAAGENNAAIRRLDALRVLVLQQAPDNAQELAQVQNDLAMLTWLTGHPARALPLYQHALRLRLIAHPPGHPALVETWLGLSVLYCDQGEIPSAREAYDQALEAWRQGPPEEPALPGFEELVLQRPRRGPSLTFDELAQRAGQAAPWQAEQLTRWEYRRWWMDGSHSDRRRAARGRRGQILLRASPLGFVTGPYWLIYSADWFRQDGTPLELDQREPGDLSLRSGAKTELQLSLGYGLLSWLELEVGIGARPGRTSVSVGEATGLITGGTYDSNLARYDLGLCLFPPVMWPARPWLGFGASAIAGPAFTGRFDELALSPPDVDGFMATSAVLRLGLEYSVSRRLDLILEGEARRLLGIAWQGPEDVSYPSLDNHGYVDPPTLGARASLQLRIGPFQRP